MKTVKTLAAVRQVVALSKRDVFVRWSKGAAADARGGWVSKDQISGSFEGGLSVVRLDVDSDYEALTTINEYSFLRFFAGATTCYLVTGDEAGEGADGEPLLVNCEPLARVGGGLIVNRETRELVRLPLEVAHEEAFLARLMGQEATCSTSLSCCVARLATARAQIDALTAGAAWDDVRRISIRAT